MSLWEIVGLDSDRKLEFREVDEVRDFGAYARDRQDSRTWFLRLNGVEFGLGYFLTAQAVARGLSDGRRLAELRTFPAGVDASGNPLATIIHEGRIHWDETPRAQG